MTADGDRMARWQLSIVFAAMLGGCPGTHNPTIDGVPEETRVVDVTDEEWTRLCAWRESARGDLPVHYLCRGAEFVSSPCPDGSCNSYDWSAATCNAQAHNWRDLAPDCPATVGEWARCVERHAEQVCHYVTTSPECDLVYARCEI